MTAHPARLQTHECALAEITIELARPIFLEGEDGHRPVFGASERFQRDPAWHDALLFHEYFHSDDGTGLGASHQTGWTGLVAHLLAKGGPLDREHREDVLLTALPPKDPEPVA
jgi:hypothetical protein